MLDTPRSVREVTEHIRGLFDTDPFLSDIWISGEVIESNVARSGHVFFTLSGDGARMHCVMFRMNALRQRNLPSPGSACVAHGKVEVYPTDGTYQFYVDLVEEAGIGLAALELELLRQQLEAEGLFSQSRKRPIPSNPVAIGVVTSASGAVWHDIQHIVRRRYPFVKLILAPASVQGAGAPSELVDALQSLFLQEIPDVIIIARGGGAASDLAPFNDERLVRSVFSSPVPVISAIGHETDWTLLDLVADLRAPTPSAAAELVTPAIATELAARNERLAAHASRFERQLATEYVDVERWRSLLDRHGISGRRERLARLEMTLLEGALNQLENAEADARRMDSLLSALSPAKTLGRGYAFVEHSGTGRPVRSAHELSPGDKTRTHFSDGAVDSLVIAPN